MTATVGDLKKFIANLPDDMPLAWKDWYHTHLADKVEDCVGVGMEQCYRPWPISKTDSMIVLFTHHNE